MKQYYLRIAEAEGFVPKEGALVKLDGELLRIACVQEAHWMGVYSDKIGELSGWQLYLEEPAHFFIR